MEQNEGKKLVMVDYLVIIAIFLGGLALVYSNAQKTILLTWLASIVVSIRFLVSGLDIVGLGIILESSLMCAVMFNVTQGEELREIENKKPKWVLGIIFTLLLAASVFVSLVSLGKQNEPSVITRGDYLDLSKQLLSENFLATEILLLLGFIVLIGLGLNLRKEEK